MKRDYTQMAPIELALELDALQETRRDVIAQSVLDDIDHMDKMASIVLDIDDAIAEIKEILAI